MRIDFSRLGVSDPVAVLMPNEECAAFFLSEMKRVHPHKVVSWSVAAYESRYAERGGVCYCPYFNIYSKQMTKSSANHFNEKGYKIVEFSEVIDFGNMDSFCVNEDLDLLLGV